MTCPSTVRDAAEPTRAGGVARPYTPPMGCRICTAEERGHARRWMAGYGWHAWVEPTRLQIVQRMRRNRGLPLPPSSDLPKEEDRG